MKPAESWSNYLLIFFIETSVENDTKTENNVPNTNSTDPNENIEIPTTSGYKNDTKAENKVPDTDSTDPKENIEISTTSGYKNDTNKGKSGCLVTKTYELKKYKKPRKSNVAYVKTCGFYFYLLDDFLWYPWWIHNENYQIAKCISMNTEGIKNITKVDG